MLLKVRGVAAWCAPIFVLALAACGAPEESDSLLQAAASCPAKDPPTPQFGQSIDDYASYEGQSTCDPTPKPGVVAFKDFVLAAYPCTGEGEIGRSCGTGGTSEHKEGRAWDWMVSYPSQHATVVLSWLLETDGNGNEHAMARRLGIMYMIWNSKIWKSYQASQGWQTYTGSSPHTDHVHFSFSWEGAQKQTSFWTAPEPEPEPEPEPTPEPEPEPDPTPGPGPGPGPSPPADGGPPLHPDAGKPKPRHDGGVGPQPDPSPEPPTPAGRPPTLVGGFRLACAVSSADRSSPLALWPFVVLLLLRRRSSPRG